MRRARLRKAEGELPYGEASDRMPPLRRDGAQRFKHKSAIGQCRVRHGQAFASHRSTRPQQQIEIQRARAPAAVAAPVEGALDGLKLVQHGVRPQGRDDDGCRIGIAAGRGAERARADDRGALCKPERPCVERPECLLHDIARAQAGKQPVRADTNRIDLLVGFPLPISASSAARACLVHPLRPIRLGCT